MQKQEGFKLRYYCRGKIKLKNIRRFQNGYKKQLKA